MILVQAKLCEALQLFTMKESCVGEMNKAIELIKESRDRLAKLIIAQEKVQETLVDNAIKGFEDLHKMKLAKKIMEENQIG